MRPLSALVVGAALGRGAGAASFQEIVEAVAAAQSGWTAKVPERFGDVEEARRLCGTVMRGEASFRDVDDSKTWDPKWPDSIPSEFDVRKEWPQCSNVTGHIRDQSDCGSCWAFASTEAFNDRRCIALGETALLSVEDTLSNCGLLRCMSMGCNGGQPGSAWRWFRSTGVVTGGDFSDVGTGSTCAPYSIKPCAHHTTSAKYPKCPSGVEPTPQLGQQCSEQGYPNSYSADKRRARRSYGLFGVERIQRDMLAYGSVTAAFHVYADFPTYHSGVYRRTGGRPLGGHAVKIIGWGTEGGEDYWLVANSWNEEWGDHGTFKIRRGVDECGIESMVVAGTIEDEDEGGAVVV